MVYYKIYACIYIVPIIFIMVKQKIVAMRHIKRLRKPKIAVPQQLQGPAPWKLDTIYPRNWRKDVNIYTSVGDVTCKIFIT